MRVSQRIANRMTKGQDKSWARPVVRIATAGVSLGIALIIISVAIVDGFQSEIKKLVVGFSSHVQVVPAGLSNDGVLIDRELLAEFREIEGLVDVGTLHSSSGLLETDKTLKGVSIKGLDESGGHSLITNSLKEGALPEKNSDILISAPLAKRLEVTVGDKLRLYLVIKNDNIKPRPVRVCGVYETGLLEYDEKFVFTTSELIQNAGNRGVQAVIYLDDGGVRGGSFGEDEYGDSPATAWVPRKPKLESDTTSSFMWIVGDGLVADTAYLDYSNGEWIATSGKGSGHLYCDGYEIFIDDLNNLAIVEENVLYKLPFDTPTRLRTTNVKRLSPEIFNWLGMLDMNVVLIIGLMILISIINMVSALLIVILEKRSEVGILKALGLRDGKVITMFVWYSSRVIGRGFLIGNAIGLGFCFLQMETGIITLDPAAYYISEVPILLKPKKLLSLELLAFISCVVAMILPAFYSTRIQPSTALKSYTTMLVLFMLSLTSCSNAQDLKLGNEDIPRLVSELGEKNVAIVGNHTSIVKGQTHLVDTLLSSGVQVSKVFAPEHGFRGDQANGAHIHDGTDVKTGLPLLSLHGKHRKPSAESLAEIDAVVFDIQDVGARFYTYLSTMLLVMEACAELDIEFYILDRPNPHGNHVEGPMLDPDFSSFVGLAPTPVVHGMTLAELASMANGEGWLEGGISCDLHIYACTGYTHSTRYSLPIAPSPNLPSDASIALYPSLCFFEPTAVSIGRGTPTPFEIIGYPGQPYGSYIFTPISTPGAAPHPKHENLRCTGQHLGMLGKEWHTSGHGWDLSYLFAYADLFRNEDGTLEGFFTSPGFFDKLAGTDRLRLALESGTPLEDVEASWSAEKQEFMILREKYLLYPH